MATSRLRFEAAETVVYDPVPGNRAATRSALFSLGFRRIEAVGELAALEKHIRDHPPDLMLCEAQGADGELCSYIQQLRQGAGAHNPFLVIVVSAWDKTSATVKRVIDSGADDLVLRPFSPALLGDRIRMQIERRKNFVITSDYVGPDRRSEGSRPSNIELFHPPNSLKMKASEGLSPEEVARRLEPELKMAREKLATEKLKRDAFQICVLWRLAQGNSATTVRYEIDLPKLKATAHGIAQRSAGTEFAAAVRWCEAVLAAAEALELGADRETATEMLGQAAIRLSQVFVPQKPLSEYLGEIDSTAAIVRSRKILALAL